MSKLDRLDKTILTCLTRDARMPSAQIAHQVGVSERTVHNRVRRLVEMNVIHPIAVLNPVAFGYTLTVDIFCELEVGFQDQAVEAILAMSEISYLAISTGDQDISLRAFFRNSEEMQAFIAHKLHHVPGIRRTRTVLLPRVFKDTYQWFPPNAAFDLSPDD